MSRQFSLATVFRMTTNELLQEFFEQLGNPCWSMDWSHRPRRNVTSTLQCLAYFEPAQRQQAELILRQVFELACPTGFEVLRLAANDSSRKSLLQQVPDGWNLYCKALWFWLKAPKVFEQAFLLHEVERLSWWRKRNDLPQVVPHCDEATLHDFSEELSRILTREQGRGHCCTVEHAHRDDGTDYFLCYPDDFPRAITTHNRRGQLVSRTLRQTFEIVFAYRRQEGSLELHAHVPPRLKPELEDAFAWQILDQRIEPHVPRQVYDLNRLKERRFELDTDPADHIHVKLRRVRLDVPGTTRRILLEVKRGTRDEVPAMVERYLNQEEIPLDHLDVCLATFQILFDGVNGRKRGSMTFDVAAPDRCNLRAHQPERADVARKHLRRWGIAHD